MTDKKEVLVFEDQAAYRRAYKAAHQRKDLEALESIKAAWEAQQAAAKKELKTLPDSKVLMTLIAEGDELKAEAEELQVWGLISDYDLEFAHSLLESETAKYEGQKDELERLRLLPSVSFAQRWVSWLERKSKLV